MTTPVYHIEIKEGADYSVTFTYEDPETTLPIDLTGYSAVMKVRQGYDGYARLDVDLSFTPTLGGADGTVQVLIPGSSTNNLMWTVGVYDVFLTSPAGRVTKLIGGFFVVIPSVTKVTYG
ncbi:MAG: hypothetical protein JWP44_5097 [Mucilaginibacter sp.]|nr:hypothetical protein [Mucilaginibacter sp.]